MHLIQCFHCPHGTSRWFVTGGASEIDASIREHIAEYHPNSRGDWVAGDDWEVLTEADTVALDAHLETIQS